MKGFQNKHTISSSYKSYATNKYQHCYSVLKKASANL